MGQKTVLLPDELLCIVYTFCNKDYQAAFKAIRHHVCATKSWGETEIMFCFFPPDWLWCPS